MNSSDTDTHIQTNRSLDKKTLPPVTILIGPAGSGQVAWARKNTRWLALDPYRQDQRYILQAIPRDEVTPPFRAPHHTCSVAALTGRLIDGWRWQPGELSLAHGGVLFLDNATEFPAASWEVIREAMKEGTLMVGQGGTWIKAPAAFRLIIGLAHCPCGKGQGQCRCPYEAVTRHQNRIPRWARVSASAHGAILSEEQYAPRKTRTA